MNASAIESALPLKIVPQTGHSFSISSAVFDESGHSLFTCGGDAVVIQWDIRSKRKVRQLQGAFGPLYDVIVSPDGREVAAAGVSGTVFRWNVETGDAIEPIRASDNAPCKWHLAYSPDSQYFAENFQGFPAQSSTVRVWDTADPAVPIATLRDSTNHFREHDPSDFEADPRGIRGVTFLPNGRELLAVSTASMVLWDIQRESPVQDWDVPEGFLLAYPLFSQSGEMLALQELRTARIAILRTRDFRPLQLLDVGCVRYQWVDDRIWVLNQSGILTTLDPRKGSILHRTGQRRDRISHPLTFHATSGLSAIARGTHGTELWLQDLTSSSADSIHVGIAGSFPGSEERQLHVAWSPVDPVFASGGLHGIVRLVDLSESAKPRTLSIHDSRIQSLAFSRDGELLIVASAAHVRVYEHRSGELLHDITLSSPCDSVFSDGPSGWLATSQRRPAIISIRKLRDDTSIRNSHPFGLRIQALAFTPKGNAVVVIPEHGAVERLSLPGLTVEEQLDLDDRTGTITAGAISPGGELGAFAYGLSSGVRAIVSDKTCLPPSRIHVFATSDLSRRFQIVLPDASGVNALAIDHDLQMLFIGEGNGRLRFLDLATRRIVGDFHEHGALAREI